MLNTIKQAYLQPSFESTDYPASVLLVISEEADPKILLCKRARHLKSHPGEISFPGGKRELTDTSNTSTALRETFEETGILQKNVQVVGELSSFSTKSGLKVKPIIGIVAPNQTLIPEVAEVEKLFWVPLSFFKQDNVIAHAIKYKGIPLKTPAFNYEDEIIWGLTGKILVNFMNTVFNTKISWPKLGIFFE